MALTQHFFYGDSAVSTELYKRVVLFVHGLWTKITKPLYLKYKALVLKVQSLCTKCTWALYKNCINIIASYFIRCGLIKRIFLTCSRIYRVNPFTSLNRHKKMVCQNWHTIFLLLFLLIELTPEQRNRPYQHRREGIPSLRECLQKLFQELFRFPGLLLPGRKRTRIRRKSTIS